MGASGSTGNDQRLDTGGNLYKLYMKTISDKTYYGKYSGGGVDDDNKDVMKSLQGYSASVSAVAKKRLAASLATALAQAGLQVNPEDSVEKIAADLQKSLPDPRKGKTFSSDAKAQEQVCKTIANVLNNEFTPGSSKTGKLIDASLGPADVCRQVAEINYSLAAGLHTEFLDVYANVMRTLKNMEELDALLRSLYEQTVSILGDASLPTGADKKLDTFVDVYNRAQAERMRQVVMLRSLVTGTLSEPEKALSEAMKHISDDKNGIIARLKLGPGKSGLGDDLAMSISGIGTVAAVSARVDKALRQVGMTIQDYLASPTLAELQSKIDELMVAKSAKEPKKLGEFIGATKVLLSNFEDREKLGDLSGDDARRKAGAAEDDAEKSSLDMRVEKRKREKVLIVKDFIDKSSRQYATLLSAINKIGPHLGKEIPLGKKLEKLRDAFLSMNQSRLGAINLELALIGYYTDSASREKKEVFLSSLRMVDKILDDIMRTDVYQSSSNYFSAIKAAISALVQTIDMFSGIVQTNYSGGADEFAGIAEVARSSVDLELAVNTFVYFMYVAGIRERLELSGKDLEKYGENYSDVLGDAISVRIRAIEKERDEQMKNADTITGTDADKSFMKKEIKTEFDCKSKFYRALQAVELYMKAFTNAFVNNVDDVADLKRLLEGVSFIGRWFAESTGDELVAAFELLGHEDSDLPTDKQHYFDTVGNGTFVPSAVTTAAATTTDKAEKIRQKIGQAVDTFQALKNLVNAFARIGDKFGGKELQREVFMSPYQIYKALVDFMKVSALGIRTDGNLITSNKGVAFSTPATPARCRYQTEQRYFAMCIKAMAAKILTIIGIHDVLVRPQAIYDLTTLRVIMGGGFGDTPKIIPEAAELYFRLPRLVEFYKLMFLPNYEGADLKKQQITLMADFDGKFSGIISLVFHQINTTSPTTGNYTDEEIARLIAEINKIYEAFNATDPGRATNAAINAFIAEINRRYGAVTKDQWDKFRSLLNVSRLKGDFSDLNTTNYATLPGESEIETDRRAPSDRYTRGAQTDVKLPEGKYSIDTGADFIQYDLIKGFREKLMKMLDPGSIKFTTTSYAELIRQGETAIRQASDAAKKLEYATNLIQGSGSFSSFSVSKLYTFHETVVVGLDVLNKIHGMVADTAVNIDKCVEFVTDKLTVGTGAGQPTTADELYDFVVSQDGQKEASVHMEGLVDTVLNVTTGYSNFISVRFPGTKEGAIHVDFSNLRSLVTTLMEQVKFFIDLFRPHVDKEIIKKYEDSASKGSFYWLDLNLVEPYIRGQQGDFSEAEANKSKTLSWMSKQINDVFIALTKTYTHSTGSIKEPSAFPYGNLFAKMVNYDSNDKNAGFNATQIHGFNHLAKAVKSESGIDLKEIQAATLWNTESCTFENTSLLSAFNQVLGTYFETNFDRASGKMYQPLAEGVVNSSLSDVIMNGNGLPDLFAGSDADFALAGVTWSDPVPQSVVLQSIALQFKTVLTEKNERSGVSQYMQTSLSDVQTYRKELMRANLPAFIALLTNIQRRGAMLKAIMTQTEIDLKRSNTGALERLSAADDGSLPTDFKDKDIKTFIADKEDTLYKLVTNRLVHYMQNVHDWNFDRPRLLQGEDLPLEEIVAECFDFINTQPIKGTNIRIPKFIAHLSSQLKVAYQLFEGLKFTGETFVDFNQYLAQSCKNIVTRKMNEITNGFSLGLDSKLTPKNLRKIQNGDVLIGINPKKDGGASYQRLLDKMPIDDLKELSRTELTIYEINNTIRFVRIYMQSLKDWSTTLTNVITAFDATELAKVDTANTATGTNICRAVIAIVKLTNALTLLHAYLTDDKTVIDTINATHGNAKTNELVGNFDNLLAECNAELAKLAQSKSDLHIALPATYTLDNGVAQAAANVIDAFAGVVSAASPGNIPDNTLNAIKNRLKQDCVTVAGLQDVKNLFLPNFSIASGRYIAHCAKQSLVGVAAYYINMVNGDFNTYSISKTVNAAGLIADIDAAAYTGAGVITANAAINVLTNGQDARNKVAYEHNLNPAKIIADLYEAQNDATHNIIVSDYLGITTPINYGDATTETNANTALARANKLLRYLNMLKNDGKGFGNPEAIASIIDAARTVQLKAKVKTLNNTEIQSVTNACDKLREFETSMETLLTHAWQYNHILKMLILLKPAKADIDKKYISDCTKAFNDAVAKYFKDITAPDTAALILELGAAVDYSNQRDAIRDNWDVPLDDKFVVDANLMSLDSVKKYWTEFEAEVFEMTIPNKRLVYGQANMLTDSAVPMNPTNFAAKMPSTKGLVKFTDRKISNSEVRTYLSQIIDNITAGAYSLSSAIAEVLRELADEPQYMQLQDNSIQEYNQRNGTMPLTPLSSFLYVLREGAVGTILPRTTVGSPENKLAYGLRKFFNRMEQKFTLADAPGLRANLDAFNTTAGETDKIPVDAYEKFIGQISIAARFLYGSVLSSTMMGGLLVDLVADKDEKVAAYPSLEKISLGDVLDVTESPQQSAVMMKIVETVNATKDDLLGNREKERLYNLIELNVMPINVHAMMRTMPLVNIYNYSITFDEIVAKHKPIRSAEKSVFVQTLTEPNGIAYSPNNAPAESMFRGTDEIGMGRPKFLYDQLYNKCLLNFANNSQSIAYIKPDGAKSADINPGADRRDIGAARAETSLIRNMILITNVQRFVRQKISRELTKSQNVIINSQNVADPSVTEYDYAESTEKESRFETASTRIYSDQALRF